MFDFEMRCLPSAASTPSCRVLGGPFSASLRCFFREMRCIALKKRLDLQKNDPPIDPPYGIDTALVATEYRCVTQGFAFYLLLEKSTGIRGTFYGVAVPF